MTRKATRKTAQDIRDEKAMTAQMDADASTEVATSLPRNQARECYALTTLVAEVADLFPETRYVTDNYDVTNAALDVTFSECAPDLISLLNLVGGDERVVHAIAGGGDLEGSFYVSFSSVATIKDSRDPFNLIDALAVLNGEEGVTA